MLWVRGHLLPSPRDIATVEKKNSTWTTYPPISYRKFSSIKIFRTTIVYVVHLDQNVVKCSMTIIKMLLLLLTDFIGKTHSKHIVRIVILYAYLKEATSQWPNSIKNFILLSFMSKKIMDIQKSCILKFILTIMCFSNPISKAFNFSLCLEAALAKDSSRVASTSSWHLIKNGLMTELSQHVQAESLILCKNLMI